MKESRDEAEAAEKIVDLCLVKGGNVKNNVNGDDGSGHGIRRGGGGAREGLKANQVCLLSEKLFLSCQAICLILEFVKFFFSFLVMSFTFTFIFNFGFWSILIA